ncbi:ovomucoid-like isoform X1 [Lagopus muta]|uniref:ovomucoid-like isoform X1 n=1 Tax=Lagopus muta TaxID=64668 RepID=UPI00209EA339|nr:ovomucoid-like isoform X1 [Lagopus muta]
MRAAQMQNEDSPAVFFYFIFCDSVYIADAAQKDEVDCSEYRRLERGRPIYCEKLYEPFCGSDGKTYNNKCSFCKAVLKSRGALRMKQAGVC